jgi:cathepsin C
VSENVEPYTGEDGTCDYDKAKNADKVYQARNYKYIGGAYG